MNNTLLKVLVLAEVIDGSSGLIRPDYRPQSPSNANAFALSGSAGILIVRPDGTFTVVAPSVQPARMQAFASTTHAGIPLNDGANDLSSTVGSMVDILRSNALSLNPAAKTMMVQLNLEATFTNNAPLDVSMDLHGGSINGFNATQCNVQYANRSNAVCTFIHFVARLQSPVFVVDLDIPFGGASNWVSNLFLNGGPATSGDLSLSGISIT